MASEPKTYGGKISQIQLSMIPGRYSASLNGYPENYYLPIQCYVLGLQLRFYRFRSTHGGDASLLGRYASSSSKSSADESICALHLYNMATLAIVAGVPAKRRLSRGRRGGSRPGKAPNRDLGRRQAAIDIDRDYFGRLGTSPVFSISEFERRYRMPRCVYEEVRARVLENDNYFHEKSNALGRPVFIPHYRTGNSPADSQGIGHLYSKLSFMRRAEL
jgi:hypothetical protein